MIWGRLGLNLRMGCRAGSGVGGGVFAPKRDQDYIWAMTRTYTIVLEAAEEGGFVVTVPALPEVGTQGETREEALANAREALAFVIQHRQSRGEPAVMS